MDQFDLDVRVSTSGGPGSAEPDSISLISRLACTRVTCRCSRYSCITQCPASCW